MEKDLKQLAMDIVEGKVFGTWDMREGDVKLIPNIFMPSLFYEGDMPEDTVHFYEYLNLAGPRSINGYPIFHSMYILNKKELEELQVYVDKYVKLREVFKSE